MTDAVASSLVTEIALLARIQALSADTRPLVNPSNGGAEDLEAMMRCRAERSFQSALCERTWWNLTADERDRVRTAVMSQWPEYRRRANLLDFECVNEIGALLEVARQGGA